MNKRYLNITELSEYIGMNKKTLYNWASEKRIPYIKIGGTLKFDMKEIEAWVDRKRVKRHSVWDK